MHRIFRKLYNRLDQLIGRRLPPPFEAAQEYTENFLHDFIHVPPAQIKTIIIVGGFTGDEVLRMLPRYPNAKFAIFEASKNVIDTTMKSFADHKDRVTVVNAAVSDRAGRISFHENDVLGTGSVLPLGEPSMRGDQLKPASVYEVDSVRLDEWIKQWKHAPAVDQKIDLIWCDVQGAEMQVLQGAGDLLTRTSALFLEISCRERMYEGAALYRELLEFLKPLGFETALMGNDPGSLTGNALLIKPADYPPCSPSSSGEISTGT